VVNHDVRWFQQFQIEPDDRKDQDAVWDDQFDRTRIVRAPTRAEKVSIALIGVFSIGFIVLMVVTLLVAVYISRR
jgi:hypothetical protein